MTEFFSKAGLPQSFVPATLEALKHDSQMGMSGGIGSGSVQLGHDFWAQVDSALEDVGCGVRTGMTDQEHKEVLMGRPNDALNTLKGP